MNYTTEFLAIQQQYPNKAGKGQAMRTWAKIKPSLVVQAKILAGVLWYAAYWRKEKTPIKFIPHLSTFLNDERWDDDIIADDIRQRLLARQKAILSPPTIRTEPVTVFKDGKEIEKSIPKLSDCAKQFLERVKMRQNI